MRRTSTMGSGPASSFPMFMACAMLRGGSDISWISFCCKAV